MAKPKYTIERCEESGALSRSQLDLVLASMPLDIEIMSGHDLSVRPRVPKKAEYDAPNLLVEHYAQMIILRPEAGKRLADASFIGAGRNFHPSRVMDECTGGGACSSYSFNTRNLGLGFRKDLMLDIKKLG